LSDCIYTNQAKQFLLTKESNKTSTIKQSPQLPSKPS